MQALLIFAITTLMSSLYLYLHFSSYKFTEQDAFIGYQKETPSTVVFHGTQQLKRLQADFLEEKELKDLNFCPILLSQLTDKLRNKEDTWSETVCFMCGIYMYMNLHIVGKMYK